MPGEPQLLEVICRRWGPLIYRRCLKILGNPADAADAVQEVYVRLIRHQHGLPPEPEQLRWVYVLATRICLNRVRDGAWLETVGASPRLEEQPGSVFPSGVEWLADRELASRVMSAASEDEREIAWLVLLDGHTQEEAGELLGLSRKTVGKRLNRFLEAARGFLAAQEVA